MLAVCGMCQTCMGWVFMLFGQLHGLQSVLEVMPASRADLCSMSSGSALAFPQCWQPHQEFTVQ